MADYIAWPKITTSNALNVAVSQNKSLIMEAAMHHLKKYGVETVALENDPMLFEKVLYAKKGNKTYRAVWKFTGGHNPVDAIIAQIEAETKKREVIQAHSRKRAKLNRLKMERQYRGCAICR